MKYVPAFAVLVLLIASRFIAGRWLRRRRTQALLALGTELGLEPVDNAGEIPADNPLFKIGLFEHGENRWARNAMQDVSMKRLARSPLLIFGMTCAALFGNARSVNCQATAPDQSVRFAVAHQHFGSWCYGYLYVSADSIGYEVTQPQSDKRHSFQAKRSEAQVRRWVPLAEPQDAVEIRVGHSTYHFRWLANEAEVQNGPARRMSPPAAAPPDTLIATLNDPTAALSGNAAPAATPPSAGVQPVVGGPEFVPGTQAPVPDATSSARASLPASGVLNGLYRHVHLGENIYSPSAEHDLILFYPDGRFFQGLPAKGFAGFDYEAACREAPVACGAYTFQGGKGIMRYRSVTDTDKIFVRADGRLQIGDFGVADPLDRCDNLKLEGTFLSKDDPKYGIAFSRDGRFRDRALLRAAGVSEHYRAGMYEHERTAPDVSGAGTYRISQNTLELVWSDGRKAALAFYFDAKDSRESVNEIHIGNYEATFIRVESPGA